MTNARNNFCATIEYLLVSVDENRLHAGPDFEPDPDFSSVPYVAWCVFITNECGERWVRQLPASERFNARGSEPQASERIMRVFEAVQREIQAGRVTWERVSGSGFWRSSWPVYGSQAFRGQEADQAQRERAEW